MKSATLVEIIEHNVKSYSTDITLEDKRYSVSALFNASLSVANYLQTELGLEPGDRALVLARNGFYAVVSWWATVISGGIVVPINVGNTFPVLKAQILDSDPKIIFITHEFSTLIHEVLDSIPNNEIRVIIDKDDDMQHDFEKFYSFDSALSFEPNKLAIQNSSRISHIIYTSGTSGPSKGCMVPQSFINNMADQMIVNLGKKKDDILWTAMPLFHLGAITHVVGALIVGNDIVLAKRFSLGQFWKNIVDSQATIAAVMGTMFINILNAPESNYSIRAFGQLRLVSGSPVTKALQDGWFTRFGVDQLGGGTYGLTEAALITASPPSDYRVGSAGKPTKAFEVQVVNENDESVKQGEVGEIVCRPKKPGVMFEGYWNDPERSLKSFRNLWFHTGDYGRFDADGYLYFIDRKGDFLRRGGENISPFEVEQLIRLFPGVEEAAVHSAVKIGLEDIVKYTIILKPQEQINFDHFYEWCAFNIPKYAIPDCIEIRQNLPKNAVGRVQKFILVNDGITDSTWISPIGQRALTLITEEEN